MGFPNWGSVFKSVKLHLKGIRETKDQHRPKQFFLERSWSTPYHRHSYFPPTHPQLRRRSAKGPPCSNSPSHPKTVSTPPWSPGQDPYDLLVLFQPLVLLYPSVLCQYYYSYACLSSWNTLFPLFSLGNSYLSLKILLGIISHNLFLYHPTPPHQIGNASLATPFL